jgi:hypothetical protein
MAALRRLPKWPLSRARIPARCRALNHLILNYYLRYRYMIFG